jgi:hypothetical protein
VCDEERDCSASELCIPRSILQGTSKTSKH